MKIEASLEEILALVGVKELELVQLRAENESLRTQLTALAAAVGQEPTPAE